MIKQVFVVRKDLNMRKGKIAAQCVHAAIGAITTFFTKDLGGAYRFYPTKEMEEWLSDNLTITIVLGCANEDELLKLRQSCLDAGLIHRLIQDVGRTEFHGIPTYTVLAIGPEEADEVDKITENLPLL